MCALPSRFAAFTAVSATPVQACANRFQPPVSFQLLVGSQDPELPITGRALAAPQALIQAASTWRARDGCGLHASVARIGPATITTAGCTAGTRLQTVLYQGLDHSWPQQLLVGPAVSGLQLFAAFAGL